MDRDRSPFDQLVDFTTVELPDDVEPVAISADALAESSPPQLVAVGTGGGSLIAQPAAAPTPYHGGSLSDHPRIVREAMRRKTFREPAPIGPAQRTPAVQRKRPTVQRGHARTRRPGCSRPSRRVAASRSSGSDDPGESPPAPRGAHELIRTRPIAGAWA